MTDTPQLIAQAMLQAFQEQSKEDRANRPYVENDMNDLTDVVIDGTVDLVKIAEAVIASGALVPDSPSPATTVWLLATETPDFGGRQMVQEAQSFGTEEQCQEHAWDFIAKHLGADERYIEEMKGRYGGDAQKAWDALHVTGKKLSIWHETIHS